MTQRPEENEPIFLLATISAVDFKSFTAEIETRRKANEGHVRFFDAVFLEEYQNETYTRPSFYNTSGTMGLKNA